ncbi:E3 SUMO-protein ligase KIAA1586-like [Mytilus californianus]|uniref:E3 SUMO-protein ligase KIAA1586-like n=1 Tax=Mytilus californianus TaxID=6549 RepID=UPI002248535C|nr:E3 SUMO-protein ligase KIAA1586-like [Mytilus californianus]XP_052061802.1 E3 SUMO-protein ligase KIAA1586-like [Mytilus californianus]
MDGSTDDSSVEQESIFLRYCNKGKVEHKFVTMGEPESTSSNDLYSFVIEQLHSKNIFSEMNKCVGFGSDGASNMTGVRNGLITQLKNDYPNIIGIHCLAHRLELSFKDAIKKNHATYDKLVTLLLGLYYFYKRSPLQRKGLKKTFKLLMVQGCLPKCVGGSRWMPHMKTALGSLFKSYSGYITHLQNQSHNNPKAEGLAKILASLNVVVFALMLYEVLDPLCRLSLTLQADEFTLGEAILMVLSTKDALAQLQGQKSDKMVEVIESKRFMGYTLTSRGFISVDNTKLIDNILTAINTRFSDVLQEDLEPTVISALRLWPAELTAEYDRR